MVDKARTTRLQNFMVAEQIRPSQLADISKYSRQHIYLVRTGRKEPSRQFMRAILHAIDRITRKRHDVTEIFDLDALPRRKAS